MAYWGERLDRARVVPWPTAFDTNAVAFTVSEAEPLRSFLRSASFMRRSFENWLNLRSLIVLMVGWWMVETKTRFIENESL